MHKDGTRILNKLPRTVLVKFYDAENQELPWRIPGLHENGLYPVTLKKKSWFLDGPQTPCVTHCALAGAISARLCHDSTRVTGTNIQAGLHSRPAHRTRHQPHRQLRCDDTRTTKRGHGDISTVRARTLQPRSKAGSPSTAHRSAGRSNRLGSHRARVHATSAMLRM